MADCVCDAGFFASPSVGRKPVSKATPCFNLPTAASPSKDISPLRRMWHEGQINLDRHLWETSLWETYPTAGAVAASDLPDSLVGHWPLDANGVDVSVNGLTSSFVNAVRHVICHRILLAEL